MLDFPQKIYRDYSPCLSEVERSEAEEAQPLVSGHPGDFGPANFYYPDQSVTTLSYSLL